VIGLFSSESGKRLESAVEATKFVFVLIEANSDRKLFEFF
jgi:hypothetical protein